MNIINTNLNFKQMDTRSSTQRIILHHAAAKKCSAEDIHRWHLNNGWSGAGYHFLVRKDGTIYRLRPEDEIMQEEEIKAGRELVNFLKNKYGINTVQVHKNVNATNCPGDNFPFDQIANSNETGVSKPSQEKGKIATIQTSLNEKYGLNISVDNIYGNEMKKALVKGLQTELNKQFGSKLAVDGIFGTNTYNACINVRRGAEGNITWLIQSMLICKLFNINADGIFGSATESAVREFQKRNGLSQDGIVGKNTFSKLFK